MRAERVGIKKVDRDGSRECVQPMRWDEKERDTHRHGQTGKETESDRKERETQSKQERQTNIK
jgi:hypothetical protein